MRMYLEMKLTTPRLGIVCLTLSFAVRWRTWPACKRDADAVCRPHTVHPLAASARRGRPVSTNTWSLIPTLATCLGLEA